jgi:hypothetical protein
MFLAVFFGFSSRSCVGLFFGGVGLLRSLFYPLKNHPKPNKVKGLRREKEEKKKKGKVKKMRELRDFINVDK